MRKSECDSVVSGQRVPISDTEGSAASFLTVTKGYFPAVYQLKCEIVETRRVNLYR